MLLTPEPFSAYLAPGDLIDSAAPEVEAFVSERLAGGLRDVEIAERVFRAVRDEIVHSWDGQRRRVTRAASEVLRHREGICYAKSHAAAALLRRAGIPAGICYQRLTLGDDDSGGYAIHALNTVYLPSLERWIRFDARGNKPGIAAEFSLAEERLAFAIRPQYDEIDYRVNHAQPHPDVVAVLRANDDALVMCRERLPDRLA